ncbi:MAG: nitrogen fixation protein FixL, partial [Deltaproteobacteria bacterium HGW-Deltaproteobacteria-9]
MMSKPAKASAAKESIARKQAEDALRQSEAKFRTIFESFEDLYYETDINGIITIVSPSVYRLSGWKPEEVIGQPTTLVLDVPEDRSLLMKALAEQGYVRDYEITLIKRDGSRAISSLSTHFLYDANGTPAGTAGSIRDISERKCAEETLKENERRLSTLTSNLPGMA